MTPAAPTRSWRRGLRRASVTALAGAVALVLAACSGTGAPAPAETSAADSFPVTIEHAFGSTEIASEPKRVVTWGWGSADAAIALGVIPVAIPFHGYGGDKDGVLPWIRAAVKNAGAELPTILPDSPDAPPYEAIAAAAPDVILAQYSGITKEQYDLLSEIAPVVAYPGEAWSTPWRDVVTIAGTALGRSAQAEDVLAGIDSRVADAAAAHPELEGKTVALVVDSAGTFYVYTPADPRVQFTLDLGLTSAPSVEALDTKESTFYYTLSYEKLDQLTSDILVQFAATQEEADAFLGAGYAQAMPQVKAGAVASAVGTDFVAAVSPPTALSLPYRLDDYVALLSAAAAKVDAAG